MSIRPRVILVEIHPWLYVEKSDWVTDYLEKTGYEIVFRSGHDGIELNLEDFKELLDRSSLPSREARTRYSKYLENGARWPVIAVACKINNK